MVDTRQDASDARQDAMDARQDAMDARIQVTEAARLLVEHDKWEQGQQDKISNLLEGNKDRIERVETAIIAINHASTEMAKWAGNVDGQLTWIRVLVGATAVAAIGQLVVSAIYSGILH